MAGYWELATTELIRKTLRKGMIFIDIGANIGYFTIIASQIVGGSGKVLAFEPDTTNFLLLKKSVVFNHFSNCELFNCAVSNKSGKLDLYLAESPGGHSIVSNFGKGRIQVNSVTLDSLLSLQLRRVDLVKIDVEKAEALVCEGGLHFLRRYRPRIILEFNKEAWVNKANLFEALFSDYVLYRIVNRPWLIQAMNTKDLANDDGRKIDVYLVPRNT